MIRRTVLTSLDICQYCHELFISNVVAQYLVRSEIRTSVPIFADTAIRSSPVSVCRE